MDSHGLRRIRQLGKLPYREPLVHVLGLDGNEVFAENLRDFLLFYFGKKKGDLIQAYIYDDLNFFLEHDPASIEYSKMQILSVRRGMAAIAAHRIFQELLLESPENLYDIEVIAK